MLNEWATGPKIHAAAHIYSATHWQVSLVKQKSGFLPKILFQQGTWDQNYKKCCSLGMTPIAFETISELECLSNLTKSWFLPYSDLFK
jgi:hypothetical protein